MSRVKVVASAAAAMLLVLLNAAPASAKTTPRSEEWWFTSWDVTKRDWPLSTGKGVTVAVLDTGVQADIPDLRGVVLPGADVTGGGGDGTVDVDDDPVPGHGTGMASLIASQGRGTGFVGLAPGAKILPVVAHTDTNAVQTTVDGIHFAVDHHAQVINISMASAAACPAVVQESIGYALDHNVVVVASAGNEGDGSNFSVFPANCAGVLAVGAVGIAEDGFGPWEHTQRQPYVVVSAPGADVGSVLRDGQFHTADGGTSGAAALTSAAVALVRSRYPKLPAREVVHRIIASAMDIAPTGRDNATGYGLIRPNRALNGNLPKNAPNPVYAAYDQWKRANQPTRSTAPAPHAATSNGTHGFDRRVLIGAALLAFALLVIALVVVVVVTARSRRRRRS